MPHDGTRGLHATTPFEIPLRGWWEVAVRVYRAIGRDNLSIAAAGVAFFTLLAIFPAIAALVTVYALIADPADVVSLTAPMGDVMPPQALGIVEDQLQRVTASAKDNLTLGLILSLLLSIWSATKGTKALMAAMNISYNEIEGRGFVRTNALAIVFAIGGIVFAVLALTGIAAIPIAVELLSPPDPLRTIVLLLRWPIMAVLALAALAVIYRYAPDRSDARVPWLTPGSVAAAVLWLAVSIVFSIYVAQFGTYNETFGSLGAVVTLLMWFYLSAYVICLGAELNAELEHQTSRDSTTGPERPLGSRGAYVADHVAGERP